VTNSRGILVLTDFDRLVKFLSRYCLDFHFVDLNSSFNNAEIVAALIDAPNIKSISRKVPKIVIGDECDYEISKAFRNGAIEYIKKPFVFCEAMLRINAALGHLLEVEEIPEERNYFKSERQRQLYQFFVDNSQRILSASEIREFLGVSTIDDAKQYIYRLRARGIVIENYRKQGWRLQLGNSSNRTA
jgi:biotin operon repressor